MSKRRVLFGVAINDADYAVQTNETVYIDGIAKVKVKWRCPYYTTWSNMLIRCFSAKEKERSPTYKDVTCIDDWLHFSKFKSWMETQDWQGKELDKDLLIKGNLVYGPETCVFVDKKVNGLLKSSIRFRGKYPLGVSLHKRDKKFHSRVTYKGEVIYCGFFDNPMDAHRAYQKVKIEHILDFIEEHKNSLEQKVLDALLNRVKDIQYDYDNNLETFDLWLHVAQRMLYN